MSLRILHLEDNLLDAELILANLLEVGFECEVVRVENRTDFIAAINQEDFDLILADYSLPSFDGVSALKIAREKSEDVPFIIISGALGEETAIETLKAGATDYILKHRLENLIPAVRRALRESEERKRAARAEAALRESEERYRLMVENLRDYAIFTMCTSGRVTDWNSSAERMFGYANKDVLGQTLERIFTPEDRENNVPQEELRTALENGRAEDKRWHLRKDGSRFWADGVVTALRDDETGKVVGVAKLLRDVTAQQMAENERQKLLESEQSARRKAEEANRLKDEFLATVSHELRTPLNAILGWAALLRSGKLDEKTEPQAVETIERNARAQVQLVEDLLDVSRIITGKLRLEIDRISIVEVLQTAIENVLPAASAKSIEIQTDIDTNIQPINGDFNRLLQVVWNLLSNAVKFTSVGGKIKASLQKTENHVEVIIQDTGAGIEPEFLPFVFDRFRQADSATTRVHGGLGLGLSIVKHLTEMHGGSVFVISEGHGKGSTFIVRLPQYASAAEIRENETDEFDFQQVSAEVSAQPDTQNSTLAGLRVLVVEDDADSREMLQIILEQQGAKVITSDSAADALDKLSGHATDILVSDVGMPGEDGYSLLRKVRALPADYAKIPAIALTGFAREEDNRQALSAGFDKHVSKPIDPLALITEIADLFNKTKS